MRILERILVPLMKEHGPWVTNDLTNISHGMEVRSAQDIKGKLKAHDGESGYIRQDPKRGLIK